MLQLLEEGIVYETITAFEAAQCRATPLGVYRESNTLYAYIYPGTRLYVTTPTRGCASIAFPSDPLDIARVVLGLTGEHCIQSSCCPLPVKPYILVEARISNTMRLQDGRIRIDFEPLRFTRCTDPRPFTRLAACIIELLVAYTRLDLQRDCNSKLALLSANKQCMSLLERRARGEYYKLYTLLLDRIAEKLQGCPGWREELKSA